MICLKCAIVGCGGIAQVHAQALAAQSTAQLAAFADIKPERAEAMAEKFGGNAYSSLEDLLAHETIDVLHICTPHYLHTPMAKLAAEHGINIFSEKPPVIDYSQWAEFKAVCEQTRVGVCFQNRYNAAVGFINDLLKSGKTGEILGGRAFVTWHRDAPYYTESGWRGSLKTEGGGALINQSIHTMDLLVQFMGEPTSVDATLANHHLKGVIEVEDTFEANISFGGKPAIFFATTGHCVNSPVLIELVCENCTIRTEENEVSINWANGAKEHHTLAQPVNSTTGKAYWGSSHAACIADFYDCVINDRPFKNDINGIAPTVELMLAAYRSAREQTEINL